MAHNLNIDEKTGEAALYLLKEPAWHGLGQVVTEAKSSEEVIQIAHLDWDVVKVPNFIRNNDGTFRENGSFSMVRSDNDAILGNIALKGYTPMQNKDLFDFMDALALTAKDVTYHTAGALGQGEIVFVSAKLPSYMRIKGTDDVIEKFILLSNSHNCSTAFVGQATDIRVVCANTHNAAMSGKNSSRVYLRHTSNIQARIKQAQEVMNMEVAYNKEVEEAFNFMASKLVSAEQVKQVVHSLFMTPEEMKVFLAGGISTRKQNTLDTVFKAIEVAPGQDMHRGSALWLYNGVTSYFQNVKEYKSATRKMAGIMMGGEEQAIAQKCFNMLLD